MVTICEKTIRNVYQWASDRDTGIEFPGLPTSNWVYTCIKPECSCITRRCIVYIVSLLLTPLTPLTSLTDCKFDKFTDKNKIKKNILTKTNYG